ncbi:S9 family peptidase [Chitinimonas lacunae]|uniref:Prolyl oligopeptidase family serine peptidase n=1 Tax=Chitinimonas lacunae TaxID=1963018 RepID=A0ABV8MSM6_9NEIS
MKQSALTRVTLAALLALTAPVSVLAAEPAPAVSIEALFKKAAYGSAVLSPNGKKLAVLVPRNDRLALSVIDLDKKQGKLVAYNVDWDVVNPFWVNNDRLVFSISDRKVVMAENAGGGLYAVNADGTQFRELAQTAKQQFASGARVYRHMGLIGGTDFVSDDILVSYNERDGDPDMPGADVYRLNTKTGRKNILTFDTPGRVHNWVLDHNLVARFAVSMRADKTAGKMKYHVFYREDAKTPWRQLHEFFWDEPGFFPVGMDFDNKTTYMVGRGDKDKMALYTWDFDKNQPKELVLAHPEVDIGEFFGGGDAGLIFDYHRKKIVGLRVEGLKDEVYYFDDDYANLQGSLDAHFKTTFNGLQWRGDTVLVASRSETDPGRYSLYHTKTKQLEPLFEVKPEIDPSKMSSTQVIKYKARDGMEIPAYLTLPKGKVAKDLPLVAYVHGGPHARDQWGFDPNVQLLASRGYAVLQPQFRLSTGFGWKLFRAGWKQWGMSMQDDVTDGVMELVKQGTVDKNRICIMGASYGGYATMYGLIKDPDLYQCGVNFVGVTDPKMFFTVTWSDVSGSMFSKYVLKATHGDPEKDHEYFKKASAIENADKIKAPVLMAYGSEDIRVPIIHGEKMRDRLLKQGNKVQWMVFVGEGHGWAKEENNIIFGRAVEQFMDSYIGEGSRKKSAEAKVAEKQ